MPELSAGPRLTFELATDDDGSPLLKLAGELDITNVGDIDKLVQPVTATSPNRLVIDVSDLKFADSSAIALWVRWANQFRHLELRQPSRMLRSIIQGMGLEHRLSMAPERLNRQTSSA